MPSTTSERFRELFDAHYGEIWAFARNRARSAADADDIAAETFAIGWRRSAELVDADLPRAWLFATARWVLANHVRAHGRRQRLADRVGESARLTAEIPEVTQRMLAEALDALDASDREVLLLRAWDGLPAAEVAAVLGCSVNAVHIRLHRARRRLAGLLGYDVAAPGRLAKGPPGTGHLPSEPDEAEGGRS